MAKAQTEWFGADVEHAKDGTRTDVYFDGYQGVDSDVPRTRVADDGFTLEQVMVRKPAPRHLQVKTSSADKRIGELTARYKACREGFRFAPVADKELWERRMMLAYHEMQIARFTQAMEKDTNASPDQVKLYKTKIAQHRGFFAELVDMGVK